MSWLTPSAADREQVAVLEEWNPPLYQLALRLGPALRIEPLLLRNLRRRFLPRSSADLEGELWHGALVGSRSRRAVVLRAGIARLLSDELAEDEEAYRACVSFIEAHTRHWPLLDRLEQTLRQEVRAGDLERVRAGLRIALTRLQAEASPGGRRSLARWAQGALPAVVAEATPMPEADWLALFAAATLGDAEGTLAHLVAPDAVLPQWLTAGLPVPSGPKVGLRLRGGTPVTVLEVVDPAPGLAELSLATPPPCPVHLSCEGASEPAPGWTPIWPGRRIALPADCRSLQLRTLDGRRYRLSTRHRPGPEPGRGAAIQGVWIRYAPADEDRARRLAEILRRAGSNAMLRPDLFPRPGRPVLAVAEASLLPVLTLWSAAAGASFKGDQPVLEAKHRHHLVIKLDETPLPPGSGGPQILDLAGWDWDPASAKAQELVQTVVGVTMAIPSPTHADVAKERSSGEVARLLAEVDDPTTTPERRLEIGDRLAELGDPRAGVGLRPDGLPDMDWVEVPGGPFMFGEDKQRRELPTFWMARYPVTNAQFQAFVVGGGYRDLRWWEGLAERFDAPEPSDWPEPNRPKPNVSWYEAVAYCRWLSVALGMEVRLPTEVEWEKAAQGTDGREYPWGHDYRAGFANVDEKSTKDGPSYLQQTTAVGLYPQGASPYGLLDMSGNLWEWCLNPADNPAGMDESGSPLRALRGGSWINLPRLARASYRNRSGPVNRDGGQGFRVFCVSPIASH